MFFFWVVRGCVQEGTRESTVEKKVAETLQSPDIYSSRIMGWKLIGRGDFLPVFGDVLKNKRVPKSVALRL